jgi:selenocysteine lyase/cysteine desulfurase
VLRVSLVHYNTVEEVKAFIDILDQIVRRKVSLRGLD